MKVADVMNARRLRLKTSTGREFLGLIEDVPAVPGTKNQIPFRLLLVGLKAGIASGTLIYTPTGRNYLTADYGTSEGQYLALRLYEITKTLTWKRQTKTKDPVTGLEKAGETTVGSVSCNFLHKEDVADKTGALDPIYNVVTAEDIKVNDRLDDFTVISAYRHLGVTFAEAQ